MNRIDLNPSTLSKGNNSLIPEPLQLLEFLDGDNFILECEYVYKIGKSRRKIVVPKGFVTDLASIPAIGALFGFKELGRHNRAAAIHDYLYWTQRCSRKQADNLMLIAMKETKVHRWRRNAMYVALRLFGCFAWRENRRLRAAGYLKIIPEAYLNHINNKTEWVKFRQKLFRKKVKEPPFTDLGEYTKYGDSTKVP